MLPCSEYAKDNLQAKFYVCNDIFCRDNLIKYMIDNAIAFLKRRHLLSRIPLNWLLHLFTYWSSGCSLNLREI